MKRSWNLGLGAAAVIAGILIAFWPHDNEPRYQGKKLSTWLLAVERDTLTDEEGPQTEKARTAVRHIGTNGIPLFLKWIQYRPPPWRTKINDALGNLPWSIHMSMSDHIGPGEGWLGLSILGPQAAPALPTLSRWMNDPSISGPAINVLRQIGDPALPALAAVLTNKANPYRGQAALELVFMGEGAKVVVPELIRAIESNDKDFAEAAVVSLGHFRVESEIVVPALARCLSNSLPTLRRNAARALGKHRQAARAAIPALLRCLDDADPQVRMAALTAIQRIAPEELSGESP